MRRAQACAPTVPACTSVPVRADGDGTMADGRRSVCHHPFAICLASQKRSQSRAISHPARAGNHDRGAAGQIPAFTSSRAAPAHPPLLVTSASYGAQAQIGPPRRTCHPTASASRSSRARASSPAYTPRTDTPTPIVLEPCPVPYDGIERREETHHTRRSPFVAVLAGDT